MITYQYKCDNCGGLYEFTQSIQDKAIEVCTKCNGKLRRVISGGSGFILKDDGYGFTNEQPAIKTRCGKTETCCGSPVPCDTPACES